MDTIKAMVPVEVWAAIGSDVVRRVWKVLPDMYKDIIMDGIYDAEGELNREAKAAEMGERLR